MRRPAIFIGRWGVALVVIPVAVALLGAQEWVLILLIAVLFFGASRIPELARSLGRAKGEFEKGARESREDAGRADAEDARVLKAARELGIPTEGRPIADVKKDVRAKLS